MQMDHIPYSRERAQDILRDWESALADSRATPLFVLGTRTHPKKNQLELTCMLSPHMPPEYMLELLDLVKKQVTSSMNKREKHVGNYNGRDRY